MAQKAPGRVLICAKSCCPNNSLDIISTLVLLTSNPPLTDQSVSPSCCVSNCENSCMRSISPELSLTIAILRYIQTGSRYSAGPGISGGKYRALLHHNPFAAAGIRPRREKMTGLASMAKFVQGLHRDSALLPVVWGAAVFGIVEHQPPVPREGTYVPAGCNSPQVSSQRKAMNTAIMLLGGLTADAARLRVRRAPCR